MRVSDVCQLVQDDRPECWPVGTGKLDQSPVQQHVPAAGMTEGEAAHPLVCSRPTRSRAQRGYVDPKLLTIP